MGTDKIRTVDYMLTHPGKVTGLLKQTDHSAVTMGHVCTFILLTRHNGTCVHCYIIDLVDSSER